MGKLMLGQGVQAPPCHIPPPRPCQLAPQGNISLYFLEENGTPKAPTGRLHGPQILHRVP